MPLRAGDTFFLNNTGGAANPAGSHLMICLIVDPDRDSAIIVPTVTRHEHSDPSCVFNVGDHPFIQHESCASYDFAREISLKEVNEQIDKRKIKLQERLSKGALIRLLIGFVSSDETTPRLYEAARGPAIAAGLKHRGYIK